MGRKKNQKAKASGKKPISTGRITKGAKRGRKKAEARRKDFQGGSHHVVAVNYVRNGGQIKSIGEDNEVKVEVNDVPTDVYKNFADGGSLDLSSKREKVRVVVQRPAVENDPENTPSTSTQKTARRKKPISTGRITKGAKRGRKKAEASRKDFQGNVGTIAENVLLDGAEMDINAEGNEFDIEIEDASEIPKIRRTENRGSTMRGTYKNNKFKAKIKMKKSASKSEKEADDGSKDAQPHEKNDAVPSTPIPHAGSSNAKSSDGAKVGADCIHFSIKSLAKNEIIRPSPESPFKKSDKLSTIRRLIGKNQSDCKLFDNNEKPLDEEKTFEENGIKTGAVIILAKEQLAGTCSAPGHAKRAR